MRKRILIFLGGSVALLLLAVATLPWWMGSVVRHWGGKYGVTFSTYSNIGYGRWAMEDVAWQQPGTRITVSRIEGPHPLAWGWQRTGASAVVVDGLSVTVKAAEHVKSEGPGLITDPFSLVRQYFRIASWLPRLELRHGEVSWAEGQVIEVNGGSLHEALATAARVRYRGLEGAVEIRLTDAFAEEQGGSEVAAFEARALDTKWSFRGSMESRQNQVLLTGEWLDQAFTVEADFGSEKWIPDAGAVSARNWTVPAAQVGVADYYEELYGDVEVTWSQGRLALAPLRIEGRPRREGPYPPLSIRVSGEGNWHSATIRQLEIATPGLALAADEPFEISRDSVIAGAVSHLDLEADLDKLPQVEASGRVQGRLTVTARENDWPKVEGSLRGDAVKIARLPTLNGNLSGRLTWPTWSLAAAEVTDEHGSAFTLTAAGNGKDRSVTSGDWTAHVTGKSLQPFVPANLSVERITAQGEVAGPWPDLAHSGTWKAVDLNVAPLNPLAVTGNWQGRAASVTAHATATAGQGKLVLEAQADLEKVRVVAAVLEHADGRVLHLTEATTIDWADGWAVTGGAVAGVNWTAKLDTLTARAGRVAVQAEHPDLSWINDWWTWPEVIESIESLQVSAAWNHGPLRFEGNAVGALKFDSVGVVRIAMAGTGDETGAEIRTFEFGQNNRVFATVAGRVPAYVDFFRETPWEIDRTGAIDLRVLVEPNPEFWKAVGESKYVTVSRPDIAVTVRGTWEKPQATGQVAVGRLRIGKEIAGYDWPEITDLTMTLAGDLAGVKIDAGQAKVDGQTIKWSGRLPVDESGWARLQKEPMAYLRDQGAAHIQMSEANLATVAKFVPDYLVPVGQVSVDLSFSPGGKINGNLRLKDAVSRPLGPLGALQDIEAEISFEDRTIHVARLQALMGGQPVRIEGDATWEPGRQPELNLKLIGTNLPLVRQTGLLLRGDLDLTVTSDAEGQGAVSGLVKLHDGLMLADIRSLVPTGGGERRETRPPYFSVGVDPFAEWDLDLSVQGHRFMRLRTPLLTGEASIALELDGTLRNPRALGDVTLEEGEVKLPFARFAIDEGRASLTEAQPYQPQLSFSGSGKRFGYDLTMELTGSASDPQLRLSSDPALPAADVILMVMAGVVPKEEFAYSQGERAVKLGVYFGQELVSDLLGWEGEGRLSLTTGEKLSRRGKETYRVGYEWSDRWTVTGEYDEFDQYNAGLKWRWLPKPDAPSEEEANAPK